MTLAILLSLANLALYCMQQLGVTLGVGAETVLLVAYLQSVRDGVVDEKEQSFARAVRHVKDMGLFLMILSGAAIVTTQFLTGQLTDFLSVIVWFKWSLIGIVLFMTFAVRGYSLAAGLLQGLSAGTWYALFAVHILAPTASWLQLGTFYALWLVGFCLCWSMLVFALRGKPGAASIRAYSAPAKPAQRPAPVNQVKPAQGPAPVMQIDSSARSNSVAGGAPQRDGARIEQFSSKKIVYPTAAAVAGGSTTPPLPSPPKSVAAAPAQTSISPIWLHVMPKTPDDLAKRNQ